MDFIIKSSCGQTVVHILNLKFLINELAESIQNLWFLEVLGQWKSAGRMKRVVKQEINFIANFSYITIDVVFDDEGYMVESVF